MKIENAPPKTVSDYASQCVKCALCLEHCPTYQLTLDENESPRGRIALFQAIDQETLPLTAKVKQHLDQCLGCRACEKVCPAKVEYGALLVQGRALVRQRAPNLVKEPISVKMIKWLAIHPTLEQILFWVLWVTEKTGLRKIAQILKIPSLLGLKKLESLLPPLQRPQIFKPHYAAIGEKRGIVQLFKGCLNSWCDEKTLAASIFVLRKLGYEVIIPPQQNCCGAMALHAGQTKQAHKLAKQNVKAFTLPSPIITVATGCQSVLQDYDKHFSSCSVFSQQITDIMRFVQQHNLNGYDFSPQKGVVKLHTPCTQRNAIKNPPSLTAILKNIPQLKVETLSLQSCCGSAGTYMLENPHFSEPLLDKLLSELLAEKCDFLATCNIGCALYFKQGLQKLSSAITVVHPIVLIANSLGFKY